MRQRRRIIACVIVFLLLGAIVNVAVAWGCVLFVEVPGWYECVLRGYATAVFAEAGPETLWYGYDARQFGRHRFGVQLHERTRWPGYQEPVGPPVPSWSVAQHIDIEQERVDAARSLRRWYDEEASGLPCIALVSRSVKRLDGDDYVPDSLQWGIRIRAPKDEDDPGLALPLQPIWPGFAINTLFYAGALWGAWLLFAAPFALRRRRRIKRGLCPACAYPVGESAVCTECGARLAVVRDADVEGRQ